MDKFEKRWNEKILPMFNNAKEWSDLMSVLKDLKQHIIKNEKEINLAKLKDKITWTKRLAQCLNPTLPGGVHEVTWQTYSWILTDIITKNNNCLGEDWGLYSSGLFPFFQNAAATNKVLYLNQIIKEIFVKINPWELELCLTGLLVSILPGWEEQNESNTKTIKEIFGMIRETLTNEVFYGNWWSIILRNQRLRQSGMKYMSETVPPFKYYIEWSGEKDKMSFIQDYYPKINSLVVNALCNVIEDSEILAVRLGMDYLLSHFPLIIDNDILNDQGKVSLLVCAWRLFIKNEYSTTRRWTQWWLGPNVWSDDELDINEPNTKYMFKYLIEALKKIFSSNNWRRAQLLPSIRIIEQLLSQQVVISDVILENVSFDMITCINDDILNKTKMFFNKDQIFLELWWISLANNWKKCVEEHTLTNINNVNAVIDKYIKPLRFCWNYIDITTHEGEIMYYIPIISNLMNWMFLLDIKSRDNLKDIRHILSMTYIFVKSIQDNQQGKKSSMNRIEMLKSINSEIEEKNCDLGIVKSEYNFNEISSVESILKNNWYESLIQNFTKNIHRFHEFYIWWWDEFLKIKHDQQVTRNEIIIFQKATQLIIRVEEYTQEETVPKWWTSLQKIIFCGHTELSVEGSNYWWDWMSMNIENKHQIYKLIKESILNQQLDSNCIDKEYWDEIWKCTHMNPACADVLMGRLWLLIQDQSRQKAVIDWIVKLFKSNINIFINTVSNTFNENSFDNNVKAIKQFSLFWKWANEFYPDTIFFPKGECIFKMLDFLDHEHPLLRHLSKCWLNQSVGQFYKVLDPLLIVLLSSDNVWMMSEDNKLYFQQEYDNRRIMAAFRKWKNIIINTTDPAIKYIIDNKIKDNLLKLDEMGNIIDKKIKNSIPRENYLNFLVSISLRFIQGKLDKNNKNISKDFEKENYSVNAASCEFLEFLLSFIEPKDELIAIASYIAFPAVDLLNDAIVANDEVMQVQWLNLLIVLWFSTRQLHKKYKTVAHDLFTNQSLITCLTKGIQIPYFFVRGQFIYFVERCWPIFSEILDRESLTVIALKLISTTWKFLATRVKYSKTAYMKNPNKFSMISPNNSKFIIKNYLEEYKDYKSFDENDIKIIVKGWKEILFHFLDINWEDLKSVQNIPMNSDKLKKDLWPKIIRELNESNKPTNTFGDYWSGLFSTNTFDEREIKDPKCWFKKEIYNQLENIWPSFTTVWMQHSDDFINKDYCLNDNGILAYKADNSSAFNSSIWQTETWMELMDNTRKPVKAEIIEICYQLFLKSPIDFMTHFISLWMNEKNNILICNDILYKLSMIEMLISINIPLNVLLLTIYKIYEASPKFKYMKSKNKNFLSSYSYSVEESKLCFLLYSYLWFNYTESRTSNSDVWNEMIKIMKLMLESSKIAYTYCWLYELLNIMLLKFPLASTINYPEIKDSVTDIHYTLNRKIMDIVFNNKFDSVYESQEFLTVPILPSLYKHVVAEVFPKEDWYSKRNDSREAQQTSNDTIQAQFALFRSSINVLADNHIFESQEDKNDNKEKGEISSFYLLYYNRICNNTYKYSETVLQSIYQKIAFLTLHYLYYSTTRNIYYDKNSEWSKMFGHIIGKLLDLMQADKNQNNNNNGINNNNNNNLFLAELSTEFLKGLMIDCPNWTASVGKQKIMNFF